MKLNDRTDAYSAALARELRRRREEAGLSKNRLAEMAGLSQQMVSYVEKEVRIPTTATLYRISEALGTLPGVILSSVDASITKPKKKEESRVIHYQIPRDEPMGMVAEEPRAKSKRENQAPVRSPKRP